MLKVLYHLRGAGGGGQPVVDDSNEPADSLLGGSA